MDLETVGYIVGFLFLGGISALKEYRDRRDKKRELAIAAKYKLAPNPTRCLEHTEDIRYLKEKCGAMATSIAVIDTRLSVIQSSIADIRHDVDEMRRGAR